MKRKFKKLLVLGSGPVKMGQSFEFDYSALQVCRALKEENISVVLVNADTSSLSGEIEYADMVYTNAHLDDIIKEEKPDGAILLSRGEDAQKSVEILKNADVQVIDVDFGFLRKVSNRIEFFDILDDLNIKHTINKKVVGTCLEAYVISDGGQFFVPAIYEHIEKAHVNTGDSLSVAPTISIDDSAIIDELKSNLTKIANELKFKGIINVQFVIFDNQLYVSKASVTDLELLSLASKAGGVNGADLALRCMTGEKLCDMGITTEFAPAPTTYFVRVPKYKINAETGEIKVTGGAIAHGSTFDYAILNAIIASGARIRQVGAVLVAVRESDKSNISRMVKEFASQNFKIYATGDTAKTLNSIHIPTSSINAELAVEMIKTNKISYVVSTIEKGKETEDDMAIRSAALKKHIPLFATVRSAHAFARALEQYNFLPYEANNV